MIQDLAIRDIAVPVRLRAVDPAYVEVLAESVRQSGLQTPVTVRQRGGAVVLVAGAHRLEACRALGHETIRADLVGEIDDDQASLIEIDENLVRRDLSALDRAVFLTERQAVWLRMYPETAGQVAAGKGRQRSATDKMSAAEIGMPSFADATAARINLTPRTIRRDVALVRALDAQARATLAGSDLADNASALRRIAALSAPHQRIVASHVAGGRSLADALARVVPQPPRDAVADQTAALLAAWGRAGSAARARFLTSIGASVDMPS